MPTSKEVCRTSWGVVARRTRLATRLSVCAGRRKLWVRNLHHPLQQLLRIAEAFAASWFGSQGLINCQNRAIFICNMGAKVAIGDRIAKANVHSAASGTVTGFHVAELRAIRNLILHAK